MSHHDGYVIITIPSPCAPSTDLSSLWDIGVAKSAADLDWKKVRATVARSDVFIRNIFDFNVNTLDPALRSRVQKRYMEDPNFTRAIVARASPACASLFDWVESSLSYASIKDEVQPLQDRVAALSREQAVQQQKMSELTKLQTDLNARIEQYKTDYSRLMAEVARINAEMANVEKKVTRSKRLLTNLSAENSRWEDDSKNFQTQIATVVGDCLLSAAFLAYIGYFNQTYRVKLVEQWQERLEQVRVPTKSDVILRACHFLTNSLSLSLNLTYAMIL
jgi:dynein heavy chain 1